MAKPNHLSVPSKISYALSGYLGRLIATKEIKDTLLSFFFSREYKDIALCNISDFTIPLATFLNQHNIKVSYIIDSAKGGGNSFGFQIYKPNRWDIPSVDAIIVLAPPKTKKSSSNIRSTIKELDKYISCSIYSVFDLFKLTAPIKPIKKNYMFYRDLDPKYYAQELSDWYKKHMGYSFDLTHPKTFNEKLQWMKLYDNSDFKTKLSDKYTVRDWIKDTIGDQYLIPILGVYDHPEEIDYDSLPNEFVIKCNHGSGMNIVVKDKETFDRAKTTEQLNMWLSQNYAFRHGAGLELNYKNIKPKIIIEKMIKNKGHSDLIDYKLLCVNGSVKFIQIIMDRSNNKKMSFYDTNWIKQQFNRYGYDSIDQDLEKPNNLNLMLSLAKRLSMDIKFVRVDLYRLDDGSIFFGEMTFYPNLGLYKWSNETIDKVLGDMLVI